MHGPEQTTAIKVGADAVVGDITIHGDVAGRDIINVSEEVAYDVSDLNDNPYLGLANYTYATRAFYGGREAQIRDAVDCLTAPGDEPVMLFVTGASGSGKSSYAQAGLVPALEQARAAMGQQVRWSVVRAGRHPVDAFAQALQGLGLLPADGCRMGDALRSSVDLDHLIESQTPASHVNVLIFDQFEELFTQADPKERDAMIALLSCLSSFKRLRTQVIATLRADYLPALFNVPALLEPYKRNGIDLRAMSAEELARAMRKPLQEQSRREGKDKRLDPALVERLVEDVGDDPALLPLLQVTLQSLFERPPHKMVLERYRSLTDALEERANEVLERDHQGRPRSRQEQDQLIDIFMDLVEVSLDDDPRRDVRRAVVKQELLRGHPERVPLLEDLVRARLIATSVEQRSEGIVEVVDIIHETLLGNWSRLRACIASRREALQQRERFRFALEEWLDHQRGGDYLLDGVRLAEARILAARDDIVLRDADGRAFLERSNQAQAEARTRELRQARRRQRILAAVASVAVLFAAAAIGAATLVAGAQLTSERERQAAEAARDEAENQRSAAQAAQARAEEQARIARGRQLAAQAVNQLSNRVDVALLLSVQAFHALDSVDTRSSLQTVLQFSPSLTGLLYGHAPSSPLAFTPDGKTLAWADEASIHISDVGTRLPTGRPLTGHTGSVWTLAFSPDGRTLASAGRDGTVRLWNWAKAAPLGAPLTAHPDGVWSLAFSPDGRTLASSGANGAIAVWDVAGRRTIRQLSTGDRNAAVVAAVYSPDGSRLAAASRRLIYVWDMSTGEQVGAPLEGHTNEVADIAWSPDGRTLASGSWDRTIRLWDSDTLAQSGTPLVGHTGFVEAIAFAPDGKRLASSGQDQTLRFWDLASRGQVGPSLIGVGPDTGSLAFSPDGEILASGSSDGIVRLWSPKTVNLANGAPIRQRTDVLASALSPDGRIVATATWDNVVQLWDAQTHAPLGAALPTDDERVYSLAFSPDGRTLASTASDGVVRLWDTGTHEFFDVPKTDGGPFFDKVAYSPDGVTLATAGRDGPVQLWNVIRRERIGQPLMGDSTATESLAFSPDGKLLVVASRASVRIWDVAGRKLIGRPITRAGSGAYAVTFSPDGSTLAIAGTSGTAGLWDITHGQPIEMEFNHSIGLGLASVAFSPDGNTLATVSNDGTVRLWDVRTSQPIGGPVAPGRSQYNSAVFTPDGSTLVVSGIGVYFLDVSFQSWSTRACRIANRNLTPAEWAQFVGTDVPYERTCPELP